MTEQFGTNPESVPGQKSVLIKGTIGNKTLEASRNAYAEAKGQSNVDWDSPEGNVVSDEWLINNPDSSPELNNEMIATIQNRQAELEINLKNGDRETALASITTAKALLEKLEQGINNIA